MLWCACRLEQFAERMNYSATLLCQRLDAVADSPTGQTIDMYPLLADLTMARPAVLQPRADNQKRSSPHQRMSPMSPHQKLT